MSKTRTELRPYRVRMFCDKCAEENRWGTLGEMLPTGAVQPMYPLKYPHACTSCDNRETYDRIYPYVDYEEVGK